MTHTKSDPCSDGYGSKSNAQGTQGTTDWAGYCKILSKHISAKHATLGPAVSTNMWVCLKIGYIPNYSHLINRDNDQQNHWV